MKRIFLATCMTAILGVGSAMAGPEHAKGPMGNPAGPEAMFDRVDANGDGTITREEAQAQRGTLFDRLDRNTDGYLEAAEEHLGRYKRKEMRKMHRAERKADRHLELDANADGKVSLAEFEARPSPMFDKLDSNADGTISAAEHTAAKRSMFARLDVNADGFLSKADKQQRRAKMRNHKAKMDTDQDGRISREEFINAPSPIFAHLDQNEDGIITREEAQSAPKMGMRKRGKH
jgi:Ca2+-binding EF-hand superfamily protein